MDSQKYEWIFTLKNQVQRNACEIERKDDTFTVKSRLKDPIPGTIDEGNVTVRLQNDAKLPTKSERPAVENHPGQVLSDTLGKIRVKAPELGGKMKLSRLSVSPVTTLFRFEFENGDIAVLITTRMRDDRPKDDSAVVQVEPRYQRLQEQLGSDVMQVAILGEAPNRMLECRNRRVKAQVRPPIRS